MQVERSVTSDISSLLDSTEQFSAAFDEEANFCAGATQIHTHSPTCVKYSLGKKRRKGDLCRFKAPWSAADSQDAQQVESHDLPVVSAGGLRTDGTGVGGDGGIKNRTRQFLMRVANRIFTERPLSQVEVVAHLLGYPSEFTNSSAWAYLNVSLLYWHVFCRWRHLQQESGIELADSFVDESIIVEEAGQRISFAEAYRYRVDVLRGLCLYDYVSLVWLKRVSKDERSNGWGEVPFESDWSPGKHAVICFDGYLSKDFDQDDEGSCHHAKRDAKQWASSSGDEDLMGAHVEEAGAGQEDEEAASAYQSDNVGSATRLIDVVISAVGANQITARPRKFTAMVQRLCRFQQSALSSTAELQATVTPERSERRINTPGRVFSGAAVPPQDQVKAIKSQQICASKERVKMIQGI
ncbi:hypothetical protein CDV31_016748 [Fusarium ambrosium]|uniref:Uncharacterized protein n=1 Tax=Fusarium ambrosium TaxID=131363 RepID=A0A428S2N6_9HYPO|nr:hypothetical protein CDV31_016748 [Fusarium ambrosium]